MYIVHVHRIIIKLNAQLFDCHLLLLFDNNENYALILYNEH